MASSYSTDLKLELMVTGENAGTWGDKTNTNLNLIQQAIAGYEEVSIAGGAQTTALAMTDATISNARNQVIKLTGTITGNQIVTIPDSIEKSYIIINGTTGSFTVEFKTVSGTGYTFAAAEKETRILISDGTNVVDAGFSSAAIDAVVEDTTPQLGGNLDVNGNSIVSVSNGDIAITPNGTGKVILDGLNYPTADGTTGQALTTNGSGTLSFSDVSVDFGAVDESIIPDTTDTYDLGSSSKVWANIYTGDLNLSNEAKEQGNDIDGTKGSWTIQEGADNLYLLNNKSGKKYKFTLEEI
jgi:hypothetical protein